MTDSRATASLPDPWPGLMDRAAPSDQISAFLEQFDAYVQARAELRTTTEGSEDERLCIARAADAFNRLQALRAAIA